MKSKRGTGFDQRMGNIMKIRSFVATGALAFLLLPALLGCESPRTRQATGESAVVVSKLIASANSWDGKLLPAYPSQQPEITILKITIPAGARLRPHSHPVINAGVLLSGQLTVVTTNGATLHLHAGDPIVEVVNTVHYGVNEGKVPAEIIVFYAGTVDQPTSIVEDR